MAQTRQTEGEGQYPLQCPACFKLRPELVPVVRFRIKGRWIYQACQGCFDELGL